MMGNITFLGFLAVFDVWVTACRRYNYFTFINN